MTETTEKAPSTAQVATENAARICRVTCGWKLPHLDLAQVRPYWRDAHSPAIARRAGIWEYRHFPLDAVQPDLFGSCPGINFTCPADAQLMWLSDVRYADEAGLAAFSASPGADVLGRMLGDIEMIVDRSTTYRVLGDGGRTLIDRTVDPAPCGPAASPTYGVFFRARWGAGGASPGFRQTMRALASDWAARTGVRRLRLSLFETPDMEAERRSGYPVKTHPEDQQYQAWIDLVLDDARAAEGLFRRDYADEIAVAHGYSVPAVYTFNQGGRPTLAGLRGYAASAAIGLLNAGHQKDPALLHWMYGPAAEGVGE